MTSDVYATHNKDNYFKFSYKKIKDFHVQKNITLYNLKDSTLIWNKSLNNTTDKRFKTFENIYIATSFQSENRILFFKHTIFKKSFKTGKKIKSYQKYSGIVCLDNKTGEEIYNTNTFEGHTINSKTIVSSRMIEGNKLVILAQNLNKKFVLDGYKRFLIDANTGELISVKTISFQDVKDKLALRKNNKLKKGYTLRQRDFTIHKNGKITLVFEKYKDAKNPIGFLGIVPGLNLVTLATAQSSKSSDLVFFNLDSEFTIEGVEVIEKDVSKKRHADYQFSSYIEDGLGSVYYYKDYVKDSDTKIKIGF